MPPVISDESDSDKEMDDLSVLDDLQDEEEEIAGISEEEDYNLEDPDEIDDDLELKEDDDEPIVPVSYSKQPPRSKRRVTYYEEDEMNDENEEEDEVNESDILENTPETTIIKNQRPEDLDPDLILTDEETEYNPENHQNRLTERQRKAQDSNFIELGNGKKQKLKKETEEEAAVRKAENARRRNDYKNKQLEEEKRDTLNKLLKRRATKVRDIEEENKDDKHLLKPRRPVRGHPALSRYINNTTQLNGNSTLSYNV
ncbi:hypothetical protein CLIB1444_07S00892 [[Candida] jaroonii]|uniref:Uncharacterized protein n=1 Tax=[Candida] jaroonii TaxID=467808 RepID=A0ACA9Y9Z2_9ASCO|nr:hypothetical protein CLIB1444_07S00892 [[Candida] jaroonii]